MERAARSASAIVERGFICRLCMGNFEYSVNIFYSSEVYNIPVWTLMVYLLHVKVSKDDGLPDTVCRRCVRKLLEFKEFKEQCMKSETELRKSAKERDFFCPVKEEELGNSGRALESIDAAYTTQVTSVSTATQGPLAMDNMCPVKEEEERVMEVVAEEGIKREDDVLEGLDSGLTVASNMDPVVVDSIVDHFNYVEGIPVVREVHFDKSISGGPEISQSQLLNNSSSDGMPEGNLQLEYSRALSSSAHWNPGKIMKKEKNIRWSDSNKMSSQSNDRAKCVKNHKCKQLFNQVVKKCSPAELICDYCGERYSEILSLALHIKGHLYRKASETVFSKKEVPGDMSSNPSVRNSRNIEKEIFEASEQSSVQMNSNSKYEKPTLDTLVIFEEIGREVNHSKALLADTVTPLDKVGFVCDACGMAFQKKGNLVKHINIHIGLSEHKCRVCGKKYKLNSRLKKHEAIHANVKRLKYDLCGNEISKKFCPRKHEKAHTVLKPCKCDICGKNFKCSADLKRHLVVHTGEKPFKCELCGKMFTQSGNLKTHLSIHTGEKPFKCKFCGKMFGQSCNLKTHLSIHTGEKPFKCKFCGKMFGLSGNLKRHLTVHSDVKPYKCAMCGKMFSEKGNLETHLRIHTGVRPFICHLCGKSYTVKSSLKEHLPIHTGVKPHKCDKCGKEYQSRNGFRRHFLTHADLQPSM